MPQNSLAAGGSGEARWAGRWRDAEGGLGLTYSPAIGRAHSNFGRVLNQSWGETRTKG